MKILVLGIGSENYGDDKIGIAIVEKLKKIKFKINIQFKILNGPTLEIIDYLLDYDKIIIIDAAKMGLKPAEFKIFKFSDIKKEKNKSFISFHQFGLNEVLLLADALKYNLENVYIFGIEPKQIEINSKISPELKKNLKRYVETLKSFINNQKISQNQSFL